MCEIDCFVASEYELFTSIQVDSLNSIVFDSLQNIADEVIDMYEAFSAKRSYLDYG